MKRFYKTAGLAAAEGGFHVVLDGKPVRTPAGDPLTLPNARLAEAVAEEWRHQGEEIVPVAMPLLRLANTAQDGIRRHRAETIAAILRFGENDLICYRAADAPVLSARQREAWDPWLAWAAHHLDAGLRAEDGIAPVIQPEGALAALGAALDELDEYDLAALHVMASITGSLVLALAVARGVLGPAEAFALSRIDETYQNERWGVDREAQARAEALACELDVAARFLTLSRG